MADEEKPTTTSGRDLTVGPIRRPQAPPSSRPAPKGATPSQRTGVRSYATELSPSGRKLQGRAWALFSMLLASVAVAAPIPGIALVLVVIVMASAWDSTSHGGRRGAADLVVAPITLLRGIVRPILLLLNPLLLVKALVITTVAVVIAAAITGGLGWLFAPDSVIEPDLVRRLGARLGVWRNGPRLLVGLLCFFALLAVSKTSQLRSRFETTVKRLSEKQLTTAALTAVAATLAVAVLVPSTPWWPLSGTSSVVRWVPVAEVTDAAADAAQAEARSTVSCFSDYMDDYPDWWRVQIETVRADDIWVTWLTIPDAIRLTGPERLALIVSLHNQLPPWIDRITVEDKKVVSLDRAGLVREPVLEIDPLRSRITPRPKESVTIEPWQGPVIECAVVAP